MEKEMREKVGRAVDEFSIAMAGRASERELECM